ncbi:hypothetical protein [Halorarum salinum]|uniref:Uncharacterized protein n=1 Tax=Halorarum salinum TaxID=2743089 RepID=A0A7D5QJ98_9EURY|nr:hypothetical protein [Halobaculum salinum]QLG63584.1 hypothetical protein HUG12_18370 [Halobaculum salinum]
MRPRRALASFVGAAAMVLGLLDALGPPFSPSGAALFVAGVVGYPDTRATLEDAVGVELGAWTVTALFLACWLLSVGLLVVG